ncbi:winged helix-turn-helix domain-containing protein [Streptomyces yanii]|uniref:winged helix-turn-helix domain-containing protein n=1 Tax=Streptomyces yanii TaxID=78510 RepID=UPI0031ED185D
MSLQSDRLSAASSHSPGEVLALISSGAVATRADIARITGLARSTVSQRVDALIAHGFVDEDADGASTGGAPSSPAGTADP